MKHSKNFWSALGLILLSGLLGLIVIGSSGGSKTKEVPFNAYGPKQPIDYSHKLHAGDLKIDCKFCHTYARRSRTAGIPALAQCMACHQLIHPTRDSIKTLARAYEDKNPIEWVKVHDLPDFVYFNHKRHISAGFECQECHGPVEEMEVLYRHAPLTMGWCVSCHKDNIDKGASIDCLTCHK
jgi:hypothetical protein